MALSIFPIFLSINQVGSPSCPAQLEEVPPTEDLALVEDVVQGQAPPQRRQRRRGDAGRCYKMPIFSEDYISPVEGSELNFLNHGLVLALRRLD